MKSLERAVKIGDDAAQIGFDWPDALQALEKVEEELAEVRQAVQSDDVAHVQEELGDLLFAVANVCRKSGVDPEIALRDALGKFERRFKYVRQRIENSDKSVDLPVMEGWWQEAKRREAT